MRTSSIERYRAFVRLLLGSSLLLVVATFCDLKRWCPDCTSSIHSPSIAKKSHSSLNLSVEGDDEGLLGKCVAVRVKGYKETMTLEQAMTLHHPSPLKVGLIFLDRADGFLSSGKVVNRTGVFHLYHYLEYLLVAYHQLKELQTHYTTNDTTLSLSSPESPVLVPWIYAPLLQMPRELCGVANGINCQISSVLLQSPVWYGMESNPSWLQEAHPAYHGQHAKRQWDEETYPLDQSQNYQQMQETADMALIISLHHKKRCNHAGRTNHGWNEYAEDFPMEDWHQSLVSNLQSIPLPVELKLPQKNEVVVCYVDRQSTPRRMPDSEHDWLVDHLQSYPNIRFWHLLMQDYDGIVQLRIASECQVMIGVHGNGLSHLLWMKPKSHVLEIHWDDNTRQGGYELLAKTLEHNYMAIRMGWLVVDTTHPDFNKQVIQLEGVDPLLNGRALIDEFLQKALTDLESQRLKKIIIPPKASKATIESKIPTTHMDNWGDTHPRQCDGNIKHIHLSVGHDPRREMTVSFASQWSDIGVAPVAGVRYGTHPDALEFFVGEETPAMSYNTTFPSDSKAEIPLYFSPYQHHVTLRGLDPDTTYYYLPVIGTRHSEKSLESDLLRLANQSWKEHSKQNENGKDYENKSGKWVLKSQRRRLAPKPYNGYKKPCTDPHLIRSFTTAPKKKQHSKSDRPIVTFGIVGDLGQFTHSEKTLDHMLHESIDLVLLVGDIAYTNNDHRRWDTFFDALDDYPVFQSTPLQIATGNHGTFFLMAFFITLII